jgi:uncharacterized protein (DUF433 family)
VCKEAGWTFEEFDRTDAQQLLHALQYAAVRREQEEIKSGKRQKEED